jgi:hypothetical protein
MCPTGFSIGWHHRFSTQPPLDGSDPHHRLHCVVFAIIYFLLYETSGSVILRAHKAFMEQQSDKNYRVEGERQFAAMAYPSTPASVQSASSPPNPPILVMSASEAVMFLPIHSTPASKTFSPAATTTATCKPVLPIFVLRWGIFLHSSC